MRTSDLFQAINEVNLTIIDFGEHETNTGELVLKTVNKSV